LTHRIYANTTYLPNSTKQIEFYQEILLFVWRILNVNKSFLSYIIKYEDINNLLVPILYLVSQSLNDVGKVGLIHMAIFIILLLSGERDFGVQLSKPFAQKLPLNLPAFSNGNHADLLVLSIFKLILGNEQRFSSLYECFLNIIVNISPYVKTFHMVTCTKLIKLFVVFSQTKYLFANERNHACVAFLLEAFNNIIQYQYEGNTSFVYALISRGSAFERLSRIDDEEVENNAPAATTAATDQDKKDNESLGQLQHLPQQPQFVPTAEWKREMKSKLALQIVLRLIQVLQPQVDQVCTQSGFTDEGQVLEYLKKTTMVGLLPVPHPILIRKYQSNPRTDQWFSSYMWGVVYLRNQEPPLFYGSQVKLFTIIS